MPSQNFYMKNKKLLILPLCLLLLIVSCKKNDNNPANTGQTGTTGTTGSTGTTGTTNTAPYVITETFESGSKSAYATGSVTLITGSWTFNNALIGNTSSDVKDGSQSVRLKSGNLAMNFDINGVNLVKVSHANYGTDVGSSWQLMMSTDGGTTYSQIGNTITETGTKLVTDSFKVSVSTKVRFEIVTTSANRINLDDITFKGTGSPGITLSTPVSTPDTASSGTATAPRGVTLGTDAPPATGDNSNLLFGNPSGAVATIASMDNYLIDQGYYVESYNATKGEPNWVSWHLDSSNLGPTDRSNNFAAFSGLPANWFAAQSNSYNFAQTGFERGHNCPSADRTSSTNANSSTFLMTNMIPQAPQNNENTWANLENYIRLQVASGYEAYIIMGSYGSGGLGSVGTTTISTIANGHINVPSNIWKVAVLIPVGNGDINRVSATTRVIAVNTPNLKSVNSDWTKYITTVRTIESATGYNLLSALPQSIQDVIESQKDAGQ